MKHQKPLLLLLTFAALSLGIGYGKTPEFRQSESASKYNAKELRQIEEAKAFLRDSDLKIPTVRMVTMACVAGDLSALKKMKENGCRCFTQVEPLRAAADFRQWDCLNFLIRQGAHDSVLSGKCDWVEMFAAKFSAS